MAHTYQCEACGTRTTVFVKVRSITHATCPRREQRKALPKYVEVTK
jgi:predicted nucleic acid-binding Zn ribbon protein